jgi:hypothetical protein
MLAPDTYSLVHYREAETVVEEFDRLVAEAGRIQETLPVEYRDAFYQLVFHPVQACANLNELYVTAGRNQWYAGQGRAATNGLAAKVRDLFERDAEITRRYNREPGSGKWNHMMDQTHIGYTTWRQPEENVMPEVAEIELPDPAEMGVAVEGSEDWWPRSDAQAALPEFDVYRKRPSFIEVFNRGKQPFEFQAESEEPWLTVTPGRGMVQTEIRLAVDVDWAKAPKGKRTALIHISGPHGVRVVVKAAVRHPARPKRDGVEGFVEGGGCVSRWRRSISSGRWEPIRSVGSAYRPSAARFRA